MVKKRMALLGLACLLVPAAIAAGSSFQNGSFETATVDPGGSYATLSVGNTQITGWTVIQGVNAVSGENGGIDYIGPLWTASQGARSLDLDNFFAAGGVEQTFDTAPGAAYVVTFDMAGNPGGPPTIKGMRVTASGNASADYAFDTSGASFGSMGWTSMSYAFTADLSGSTTLSFQSLSPSGNAWGPALDNVSVAAVPEPVTMFSAFLAISGLGAYLRRRTRVA
jgi:choice-of-anchor C domain-containing protein